MRNAIYINNVKTSRKKTFAKKKMQNGQICKKVEKERGGGEETGKTR